MPSDSEREIPETFYGSSVFRYRISGIAYRAYCAARDSWLGQIPPPHGARVLDIGCSTGDALEAWAGDNFLVGFDRSPDALTVARDRGFHPVVGDFAAQPFAPSSFDLVAALGVIGGTDDPQVVFDHVASLLREGGRAVFAIAVYGGLRRVTRPLVRLLRIPNEMRHIPDTEQCLSGLRRAGLEPASIATSALFPRPRVNFAPDPGAQRRAVYLFVDARRTPVANG